ncbi:MAG TPA: STAS domain-containing protein [Tepidisphaeraceae bacterium]|jgi:anti-anti-sigma factor
MNENSILSLVSIDKDGCIRIASNGNITASSVSLGARNPLEGILGAGWSGNRVILDMSRTDFMDSTAIAWLISTTKQFRTAGGSIAIHSVVPRARQMLDILKIGKIIPIVSNEPAARMLLNGAAPAQAA